MRKKVFLISFICCLLLQANAQISDNTIVNDNCAWATLSYVYGADDNGNTAIVSTLTEYHFFDGDSIFNEKTYKKVFSYRDELHLERFFAGLIREENKKTYFVPYHIGLETLLKESILYDFSLEQGETFEYVRGFGDYLETETLYVLQSDYVLINNKQKKRLIIVPEYNKEWVIDTVIENVGSLHGLLYPLCYICSGAFHELLCYTQNDELLYQNPKRTKCYYDDVFNLENESFMQETRLIENEYSVNLPTRFFYKKKWNNGWVNIVNPFRASIVLGTPGSGKSYAIVNNYIKQQIQKGFSMYIYDFKFDDLSVIAYNTLMNNLDKYEVAPKFYVINFDNPRKSHRCNPINPSFMTDISDAYESAYTIMLNLNKTWIQKQGDFFVESPIILLAAIIWYLKIYQNGKYCTFPHAIEFLNQKYAETFPILTSYPQLENYLSPFMDAWEGGAQDQLQGQIASAKIPLSRMISPQLYWVMTGDDFSLDINNPNEPKILCVGNNPDRQNIYSAALGLYNSRIVKLINKKGQLKSAVIIDELPTIYFRGLDNLIATARSNKVAVCLGFQDFSQLKRDYGDKEAAVVMNTVGNIFSGQVVGESAKNLSERFGKVLQKRQSLTINRQDKSTSISTQLDSLIPASKISNLTQGMFVGSVSDNFDERIEQKIFHAEIVVDNAAVSRETKAYKKIPDILDFRDKEGNDKEGNDTMQAEIEYNYNQIKADVKQIVVAELKRISEEENLKHLIKKE